MTPQKGSRNLRKGRASIKNQHYQINKLLKKKGPFWQPQYYDHAVRHDEDLIEVVLYTIRNPVRAGLVKDFHDYPFWYCRWEV